MSKKVIEVESAEEEMTLIKSKTGSIYQVLMHNNNDKPHLVILRTANKFKEVKLLSVKQGLVDGTWKEVNQHERKKWVLEDKMYMENLTRKILKRVIISQLLLEVDEDLKTDFMDDKRMNKILDKSIKELERVAVKQYNDLYNIDKKFIHNFQKEVDDFTTVCATFEIHEFYYLNKMLVDYVSNPAKFKKGPLKMLKID